MIQEDLGAPKHPAGKARRVAPVGAAVSCFFRTAAPGNARKALIQVTERCNLHCAHCFVSSTRKGDDLSSSDIREKVIPRLQRARVERVTLTGGEPFVHPGLIDICADLVSSGLSVGICTNGTGVTNEHIVALRSFGRVHVNMSFDGFSAESHGRFRGDVDSFDETRHAAERLSEAGLLQGILSTPNAFTTTSDYSSLASFARAIGAKYLLMNPLSAFGRGARSKKHLAVDKTKLVQIRSVTEKRAGTDLEIVPIRFPNTDAALSPCIAGEIIYVFVHGAVAVCPYLVFAARTAQSQYSDSEFIIGNILNDEIADRLDQYRFHDRYRVGSNAVCSSCSLTTQCGKGCPAAVIAAGGSIGERDVETCPMP